MDIYSLLFIAVGLSMDSLAVSISNGLTIKKLTFSKALPIAFSFAFFQALLPLLGWLIGTEVEEYVAEIDHWIAFLLLSIIGIKMIYESLIINEKVEKKELKFFTIIGQSIATSIDALIIGIGFALLNYSIFTPVLIIGFVTFLFSMIGLRLGKFFSETFGKTVELFGGIILIGIGLKILIEHLFFQL
jgi:putative Mn2+ efflux pump MntP